jgi:hypothetical protein
MNSEILIYQNKEGKIAIDVRLEEETVWITQDQMATLFGKSRSTITEHISNVFAEGELSENVVCRKFRHTTQHGAIEGKTQETYTHLSILKRCTSFWGFGDFYSLTSRLLHHPNCQQQLYLMKLLP